MVLLLRGFWIVCVLLSICGGSIFTWTIGSICMTIPFMMTSCYEKQTSSSVVVLQTSQHVQIYNDYCILVMYSSTVMITVF